MTISNDPLAAAVEDAERGSFFYGQVQVQGSFVKLQKGVGKSAWIEGVDDPKEKRTEITFTINPLEQTGFTQLITRSTLSSAAAFTKIVWPSLRDGCGVPDLRSIDGKFVKTESAKTGRTWNDKKTGEPREETTLKFHAIYNTEAECVAAYTADGFTPKTATTEDDPAGDIDMTPNADNPERDAAKEFLKVLVKQTNGNRDALGQMLGGMPMIAKYFSVDSPEVAEMMKVAA